MSPCNNLYMCINSTHECFVAIFHGYFSATIFFFGGPMSQTDSIAIHIPTYTVPIGFVALPTSTYPVNRHNPSPFILLKKNGTVIHMTGTRLLSYNNITHFRFFFFPHKKTRFRCGCPGKVAARNSEYVSRIFHVNKQ